MSAPKGTAPGGVPNTGLIYSCPVNPGICSALSGKLFDATRESHIIPYMHTQLCTVLLPKHATSQVCIVP